MQKKKITEENKTTDRATKNLNYHEQKISINRALHRLYANQ